MPISASQIVQVNPRLLLPGGRDLELNGLLLSQDASIPTTARVLPFGDPESVGAYFGLNSEEYRLANIYFLGYNNSFLKPRAFFVARFIDAELAPFLRGGPLGTLISLKAITVGEITLTIGSHTDTATSLDFSTATSYSAIAALIETSINNVTAGGPSWTSATVEYSSQWNAFIITGGAEGAAELISYATGTSAEALGFTLTSGAVISRGADVQTEAENMQAILEITQNWVSFTTVWKPEQASMLAFAAWANSKGVAYLYVLWDDDPNLLQPNSTATIFTALTDANLSSVCAEWKSADYAAFVLAIGASIDFNRTQGAITTAFKSQDGLAVNVDTSVDAINLIAKKFNFYGNYATRNDNFIFHYNGSMFGRYLWIDTYLNAIWLNNALQVALMAGLSSAGRVPYTEQGYALVRAWMQDPVNRALTNGVIDPGLTLSEAQKAQVNREAGMNIVPTLESTGYFIQVADPAPAIRVTRDSPIVNLWYTYGGSINKLVVASTAVV